MHIDCIVLIRLFIISRIICKTPKTSYTHDYSKGSIPIWFGKNKSEDPRTANKRWMKNAWANVDDPYDAFVASVGTALFSTANLINDLTHVPAGRYPHVPYKNYKPGIKGLCGRHCK